MKTFGLTTFSIYALGACFSALNIVYNNHGVGWGVDTLLARAGSEALAWPVTLIESLV